MASAPLPRASAPAPNRKLGNLWIVWSFTRRYPLQLSLAIVALLLAAGATLWIPRTFKEVVDRGFGANSDPAQIGGYFQGLLLVVVGG